MKKLNAILDKLETFCEPISIFLYGSRARTDFLKRSDFEIGVLIPERRYMSRGEIRKIIKEKKINIYPFRYEDFIKGKIDTPFQNSIYLRELVLTGKTLRGKRVIEEINPPTIKVIDIIQDLRFNIGYALASVISYRNSDSKTASMEFYKSCLFGTRSLVILKLKIFALTYKEIYEFSKKLKLGEYELLVLVAYKSRQGKIKYSEKDMFQNISYLNKFIEPQLIRYFNKYGNKILIQ